MTTAMTTRAATTAALLTLATLPPPAPGVRRFEPSEDFRRWADERKNTLKHPSPVVVWEYDTNTDKAVWVLEDGFREEDSRGTPDLALLMGFTEVTAEPTVTQRLHAASTAMGIDTPAPGPAPKNRRWETTEKWRSINSDFPTQMVPTAIEYNPATGTMEWIYPAGRKTGNLSLAEIEAGVSRGLAVEVTDNVEAVPVATASEAPTGHADRSSDMSINVGTALMQTLAAALRTTETYPITAAGQIGTYRGGTITIMPKGRVNTLTNPQADLVHIVAQRDNGRTLFDGLLEFDGQAWHIIEGGFVFGTSRALTHADPNVKGKVRVVPAQRAAA